MQTEVQPPLPETPRNGRSRRDFLRSAGLAGATLMIPGILAACDDEVTGPGTTGTVVIDFKDDIGVLNYAYALEQLEAAFYLQVVATPYAGIPASESRVLTDIRDHEVIHRDFLKTALGNKRIPDVTPDFSSINFASRASVLGAAKAFEDLGVAAYNGAAKYLSNVDYLVVAGKIVSVEARHAAAIRDLLNGRSGDFAPAAFDPAFAPRTVLETASTFITTKISVVNT